MATYTLVPLPRIGITPEPGMLINTYSAGGSSPAATYTDSNGSATNKNPVEADANGLFPAIYLPLGMSYKFIATHAVTNQLPPDPISNMGVVIWTQDGIASVPASSPSLDIIGTAGETLLALAEVYLSDGSDGKQAGLWYNADSTNPYSSTIPLVGMATSAVSTGMTGAIRLSGAISGFTALSVGATYYVGLVGAITTNRPQNARTIGQADTTASLVLGSPTLLTAMNAGLCQGRLTLTTGTPFTTADVTAATALFFAPYAGSQVSLYDGTRWVQRQFSQLTIPVPATTSQMYDIFLFDSAGTLTLELLAWTNDTTRATALVTQDGVLCKTGALTRRYLGSFRTTGVIGQTEDSFAKRYLWNYYNRMNRLGRVTEPTNSWAYSLATYEQMNANTANQLDFVIGVAEIVAHIEVVGNALNAAGILAQVSIGQDSATVPMANVIGINGTPGLAAGEAFQLRAVVEFYPAVGRHFYAALERSTASGTTTWYGDNGDSTLMQSGIFGKVQG